MRNRKWVLDAHPNGHATKGTWRMIEDEVSEPKPGQILVRTKWLSLDPYMQGRIAGGKNYAVGVSVGEVMQGGGVGEIVTSNHPDWKVGDLVESMAFGWQEYPILTPDLPGAAATNRVRPGVPEQASLSWLGMPGLTAYVGLTRIGCPLPADTLVVSAASGAVGQLVGQLAKIMGARVIGIAGNDEKLEYCRSIGYDATINYRTCNDLEAAVREAAPNGVDVFFDNTGGPIHDAVMANLAINARVVICGRIAVVGKDPSDDVGPRVSTRLIQTRAKVQGLIVLDWWHLREEALSKLASLGADGRIQFSEDILEGFDMVPEAYVRMMSGKNHGKQLVRC